MLYAWLVCHIFVPFALKILDSFINQLFESFMLKELSSDFKIFPVLSLSTLSFLKGYILQKNVKRCIQVLCVKGYICEMHTLAM